MMSARTFLLMILVGPAAALVSLQSAILISSRVNDPRTAQQFGVLIIIPLTGLVVAQFTGTLWLSATAIGLLGVAFLGVWVVLTLFSVALFERGRSSRWRCMQRTIFTARPKERLRRRAEDLGIRGVSVSSRRGGSNAAAALGCWPAPVKERW